MSNCKFFQIADFDDCYTLVGTGATIQYLGEAPTRLGARHPALSGFCAGVTQFK
jgi:hypothetical protein